jgi:hypothetical protein
MLGHMFAAFRVLPRVHVGGGPLAILVAALAWLVILTAWACLWLAFVIVVGPFILWARHRRVV